MSKIKTIEELRFYLESHPEEGRINGEDLLVNVPPEIKAIKGEVEFSAFVPKQMYSQVLLKAAALSYNKSLAGNEALNRFLEDSNFIAKPMDSGMYTTEFPFYASSALIEASLGKGKRFGFSDSDVLTHGLLLLINDLDVNQKYEAYITQLQQKYNQPRNYIEMKILGGWRKRSRQRRYEMSLAAGHLIERRKLVS